MDQRITIDPSLFGSKPIVSGTRMLVELVLGLLAQGWTVEDVLRDHDQLTREDVMACLACAHQLLVDAKLYPVPA